MTMRSLASLVLLLLSSPAHADDGATGSSSGTPSSADETDGITVYTPLRLHKNDGPLLRFDGIPPVNAEPGTSIDRAASVLDLGHGVGMAAEGQWWSSTSPLSGLDDLVRGWAASYQLSYDAGPFRIGAQVGAGHVDGRFEHGSYRFVGLSAYRTFRLSRWMLAWISLGAGFQQWSGTPPPGEANSKSLGLTIGTTFR